MSTATAITSHDTGQQTHPRHEEPAYRAVAAVRSEASSYWRTVTLAFPEAGIRLLSQNSLSMFASTMHTYRERLQEAARELGGQYEQIKSEAERRLGTLFNASDYPTTLDGLFDLEVSYYTTASPRCFGIRPSRTFGSSSSVSGGSTSGLVPSWMPTSSRPS